MTTRIQREFSFQAAAYCDVLLMNTYIFSMCMEVESASIREQNIAMDRVKYFLQECLEGCIFIKDTEKKMIEKYASCGFNVCTLPEEPYDQIITIMLLVKINAIMDGKMVASSISLGSRLGDEVNFMVDLEEAVGPFEIPGWWNESNRNITSITLNKKDKIVNLFKPNSAGWNELGLSWKEKDIALIPDKSAIAFTIETDK